MKYEGNAIYEYIDSTELDYFFCIKDKWMLVYGDKNSNPKLLVYVIKTNDINLELTDNEQKDFDKAKGIAHYLQLPFICVKYSENSKYVKVKRQKWEQKDYDELKELYESYGVCQPGTTKKSVNQYLSSGYHDWQRKSLGEITVSDFDLIKYKDEQVKEIIELKRSKIKLENWKPYINDYPNFALLINTIVKSGQKIDFKLFYNVMKDGEAGKRIEEIDRIKVYNFKIPDKQINYKLIDYSENGVFSLSELLY